MSVRSAPTALIRLHPSDDVAVAPVALSVGDTVTIGEAALRVIDAVPAGHKVSLRHLDQGEVIHKFGHPIGIASVPIEAGSHVHDHNLSLPPDLPAEKAYTADGHHPESHRSLPKTFDGIVRPDGRIATRNYIGIITSVNCSATVGRMIADRFRAPGALDAFPGVNGVVALTHTGGCGLAAGGDGHEVLQRTLAGYARHPNFAAVLLLGLGCETNGIPGLLVAQGLEEGERLRVMHIQDEGGTARTVARGIEAVEELAAAASGVQRQEVPISSLVLGVQCGGSDGYSGITANPALGVASDILVAAGGTVILGETPEVFGAEHVLAAQAVDSKVANRLFDRIEWWKEYTSRDNANLDHNPSPGNRAGGITTIVEKSLAAVMKGGSSPLVSVVDYAEPVRGPGLVFMDTPGYDPVSATGMVAGGANLIAFTTGRGSVFGCAPAPSLKIATNSDVFHRMEGDMDINAGTIIDGIESVEEVGVRILECLIETASGRLSKSEELGFGHHEFAPWLRGAVL